MGTVYSLNDFSTGGSDADGNRMKVGHLESADCVATYTQDTVLALHTRINRHTLQLHSRGRIGYILTAGFGFGHMHRQADRQTGRQQTDRQTGAPDWLLPAQP